MESIVASLRKEYDPETLILYGSYADGSYNAGSDFDAMLLCDCAEPKHDVRVLNGIQLDVFVYPADTEKDPSELLQLYHGRLLLDRNGKGARWIDRVKDYVDSYPQKSADAVRADISWCEKMLTRTDRRDAEGYYRWHWVLCDSLEFYCNIRGNFYFGPKKTLLWMRREDPEAFLIYQEALSCMDRNKLEKWVNYLKNQMEG